MKYLVVALALILLASCASYNPGRLPSRDVYSFPNVQEKGDVAVAVRFLNEAEVETIFDANLLSAGVQAVYISIENDSQRTYRFSKSDITSNYYTAEQAQEMVGRSVGGRAAGYGIGALFVLPLLAPAIVDSIWASKANKRMKADFIQKEIADTRVRPGRRLDGVIYLKPLNRGDEIEVILAETKNDQILKFSFIVPETAEVKGKEEPESDSEDEMHDL